MGQAKSPTTLTDEQLQDLLAGPTTRIALDATRYAIARAEQEGLINECARPKDAELRGCYYKLTPKGRRRAQKAAKT